VIWGELAYRIGSSRVARDEKSLAAATAEILLAPRARAARLAHPVRAPKGVKSGRAAPNVSERVLAHIPKF
jgi:hypothetical protein